VGFAVQNFARGRYRVRFSYAAEDIEAAAQLRATVFRGDPELCDIETLDARCCHVLVERIEDAALVCCFRMSCFEDGSGLDQSYAAQFYDLSRLRAYPGSCVELGRFCTAPQESDPDILRAAWAAVAAFVDAQGVGLLFGCSSFPGTRAEPHQAAFARLHARHRAPPTWAPGIKAPETLSFDQLPASDGGQALAQMPSLLRSYLGMGAWVSDHAVIDRDLQTMHVFTGVEVAAIPPARKRALRMLAGTA
jgi:putative hemolysin